MKTILVLSISAILLAGFASCSKCYKCHNICKTCSEQRVDTVLTIGVCSDRLSEKYFVEYIDSLTSPALGWTCVDANSDYHERFCESQSRSAVSVINKKEAGLVCQAD